MDFKKLTALFRRSFEDWNKHNATRLGAALAFYTILSISPLVILTVAIVSLIYSQSTAQGHLLDEVQSLVGYQGRVSVQAMLESGRRFSTGIFSTIVGVVTLVVGASGVFQELRADLNQIWEADPKASSGIWGMLRERVFSFGLVLSVGFVLLVSLLVSAALAAVAKFFSNLLPVPPLVLDLFNNLVSLVGIGLLFACILKYVPACRVDWKDVRVGASVTAILFRDRQGAAGHLPGHVHHSLKLRRSGFPGGAGGLGLLLGADFLLRRGIYPRSLAGQPRPVGRALQAGN